MRLSHSSKEKYLECSEKWRLHYKEKLRSVLLNSPLFFGSAIDDAVMTLLLTKKKEYTEEEKEMLQKTPWEAFEETFTFNEHFGEKVYIPTYENCRYSKADLDVSLLQSEDYTKIIEQADNLDMSVNEMYKVQQFIDECLEIIKNKKELDIQEQRLYNYICWLSLRRKAEMMLEAARLELLPQIEEIYSIQEKVSLQDGEDELIGYIDFVGSFVDEPGKKYVVDLKTSSRAYPKDAVETSEQLATYSEYKNISDCAYVVIEKNIRKRHPRVRITILKGKIGEELLNQTFDNLSNVFYNVQEGNFEKLYEVDEKAKCFMYGRVCEYFDYCRTKSLNGLKYQEKK